MSTPTHETGALVERARRGDERAWAGLVERFAPLVLAVCRRHQLGDADAKDVAQAVWLALLEHLDTIREPAALPGWIATTARRECLHVVSGKGARNRRELVGEVAADVADVAETVDDLVLRAERHAAFLLAFEELPPQQKELLILLMHDPPLAYSDIADRLRIAVGSIGPTRGRLLHKIRRHPAVAALLEAPQPTR